MSKNVLQPGEALAPGEAYSCPQCQDHKATKISKDCALDKHVGARESATAGGGQPQSS